MPMTRIHDPGHTLSYPDRTGLANLRGLSPMQWARVVIDLRPPGL